MSLWFSERAISRAMFGLGPVLGPPERPEGLGHWLPSILVSCLKTSVLFLLFLQKSAVGSFLLRIIEPPLYCSAYLLRGGVS